MPDSLSVLPVSGYSMSQILVVSLIVTSGLLVFSAWAWQKAAEWDRVRADMERDHPTIHAAGKVS